MKIFRMLIAGVFIATFFSSCEDDPLYNEEDETNEPIIVDVSPFVELNTLGGSVSSANAIDLSSAGEPIVVGEAHDDNLNWVAFVSTNGGEMISKGTLGGPSSEISDTYAGLYVGRAANAQGYDRPVYAANDDDWTELHMDDNGDTGGEVVATNIGGVFIGNGTVAGSGTGVPVMWAFGSEGFYEVLDSDNTYDVELIEINDNNEVIAFSPINDKGYL